jgi:hypothetical protein
MHSFALLDKFAASHQIIASNRPSPRGFTGPKTVLLLLLQNRKHITVHILTYLRRLDKAVRQNGKSGPVSGNGMDHFQVENYYPGPFMGSTLLSFTLVKILRIYLLRVYSLSAALVIEPVKWRIPRRFRQLIAPGEDRKRK